MINIMMLIVPLIIIKGREKNLQSSSRPSLLTPPCNCKVELLKIDSFDLRKSSPSRTYANSFSLSDILCFTSLLQITTSNKTMKINKVDPIPIPSIVNKKYLSDSLVVPLQLRHWSITTLGLRMTVSVLFNCCLEVEWIVEEEVGVISFVCHLEARGRDGVAMMLYATLFPVDTVMFPLLVVLSVPETEDAAILKAQAHAEYISRGYIMATGQYIISITVKWPSWRNSTCQKLEAQFTNSSQNALQSAVTKRKWVIQWHNNVCRHHELAKARSLRGNFQNVLQTSIYWQKR